MRVPPAARPPHPRKSRRQSGLTLLELLVAVALLSVLAVLSWRGLDSVLTGRDRITEASEDLRALTVAMTQIDEDLRRSWPVRLLEIEQPPLTFVAATDTAPASLVVLREASGGQATQVLRVYYRLRDGVFERGFAPWNMPAPDGSMTALAPVVWQPLVEGVQALELRGWLRERGWVPAATIAAEQAAIVAPSAAAPTGETAAPALVTGVELSLVRGGQRIVRVFSVRD